MLIRINENFYVGVQRFNSLNLYLVIGNYILSPFGSLCSDLNAETIENLKECRSAIVDGANFTNEVDNSAWPKGCYIRGTPPRIWWNNHPTGIPNDNARQICIVKGKFVRIIGTSFFA